MAVEEDIHDWVELEEDNLVVDKDLELEEEEHIHVMEDKVIDVQQKVVH